MRFSQGHGYHLQTEPELSERLSREKEDSLLRANTDDNTPRIRGVFFFKLPESTDIFETFNKKISES